MSEPVRRSRPARSTARHGRLRKSTAGRTIARFLSAALAVVLVSGSAIAAYAVWDIASSVAPSVTLANETAGSAPDIDAIEGGVNLLLVGSDSRQGQDAVFGDDAKDSATLNDVTMLLHISEDHTAATVVSFPRDMFVPIPSCPRENGGTYDAMAAQKINTTLSYGGLACTVLTVEKLTGLSIPFAAEVQFGGVIELSNAVGGVDVCVAEPINDWRTETYLDAGVHTLQGKEAIQFLRTRHGVGDGSDLGRISNQQVFLSSLVRTLKSSETLTDPGKLFGIAKAAASNMTLSTSLSNLNTMVSIAMALKNIPLDQVVFVQYPTEYGDINGYEGVLPLKTPAAQLFDALAADEPLTLSGDTGPGSVVDPNAPVDDAPADDTPQTEDPEAPKTDATPPGVVLDKAVQGQTAGDYTCSKGND
ncbi:LytR family transcriptional regulator [Mycetocola manganoxydans]|uniref:LytR family transcriptional regulator n=1 Tax=Mycetocola manganoxydans TaxID=699879 RepID=A0A3L6ZU47_9MICO|nr:LCP family protein [Mycetocola manganoxydans]RLP71329.1 LytR family transcriptional regulator [Mycetocola manganoxydans]GHD45826.1 transcriptional regulator [Mycetocola manganoxydans]